MTLLWTTRRAKKIFYLEIFVLLHFRKEFKMDHYSIPEGSNLHQKVGLLFCILRFLKVKSVAQRVTVRCSVLATFYGLDVLCCIIINMAKSNRVTVGDLKGLPRKKALFIIEYLKDVNYRRAAEASGYDPDHGYKLANDKELSPIIDQLLQNRLDDSVIDAEWVLHELVDNHRIARLGANISASNTSLKIIAQLAAVDALAKNKIDLEVTQSQDIVDRLKRGRDRAAVKSKLDDEVSFL